MPAVYGGRVTDQVTCRARAVGSDLDFRPESVLFWRKALKTTASVARCPLQVDYLGRLQFMGKVPADIKIAAKIEI
jgi:hypothetical protein